MVYYWRSNLSACLQSTNHDKTRRLCKGVADYTIALQWSSIFAEWSSLCTTACFRWMIDYRDRSCSCDRINRLTIEWWLPFKIVARCHRISMEQTIWKVLRTLQYTMFEGFDSIRFHRYYRGMVASAMHRRCVKSKLHWNPMAISIELSERLTVYHR